MGFNFSYRDGWTWTDEQTTATPNTGWSHTLPYTAPVQKGWVCPLCGRANAPWLAQCNCVPQEVKITYATESHTTTASTDPDAISVFKATVSNGPVCIN